jgi:hypothetical protein
MRLAVRLFGRRVVRRVAFLEPRAGSHERHQVGCDDRAPALLCGLHELERHGDASSAGAGPLGDALPRPDGGEGRLDRIGGRFTQCSAG